MTQQEQAQQQYTCYTCNRSMTVQPAVRRSGEHDIKLWTCTFCNAAVETRSEAPRYATSKARGAIIEMFYHPTGQKKLVMI
jgi:ribosomal protein L37AE/L43A